MNIQEAVVKISERTSQGINNAIQAHTFLHFSHLDKGSPSKISLKLCLYELSQKYLQPKA